MALENRCKPLHISIASHAGAASRSAVLDVDDTAHDGHLTGQLRNSAPVAGCALHQVAKMIEPLPRPVTARVPAPHYMCLVKPAAIAALQKLIPAQTKEAVPSSIGVALNTWVKIRDGRPVRTGTALRALSRLPKPLLRE